MCCLLSLCSLGAAAQQSKQLTLNFTQLSKQASQLHVAVYFNADAMKVEQGIFNNIALVGDSPNYQFDLTLAATTSEVAVLVFQDLNGNQQLDKNLFGIPTEPYGVSNNPSLMGPPSYEQARVMVNQSQQTLNITLF